MKDDPDEALEAFNELLGKVIDKHAPVKKRTVRNVRSSWIDDELKDCMTQRDQAKEMANKSSYISDWQIYRKLRIYVIKLNKRKKKLYYENLINNIKHDNKKLWNTFNDIMGRKSKSTPSFQRETL